MATHFESIIADTDRSYAAQASQAVFQEIDRLESLFSCFDPSSEISRINRLCPGQSIRIGIEVFACLQNAEKLRLELGNAFDVNYKAATVNSGTQERPLLQLQKMSGGFSATLLPSEKGQPDLKLDLDLGGIGKGYALDQVVEILSDWSIENALLHAGTSTALAIGSVPASERTGWPVGIAGGWECYSGEKEVVLSDRALSGSGTEVKGQHVIDPGSGRPATGHAATWVSGPSAAVSDALSTAFMVMNTNQVKIFCDAHPEIWALVFIDRKDYCFFNQDLV